MKVAVNCPPSRKVHIYLVTDSKRLVSLNRQSILRLAGASAVEIVESGAAAGNKAVSQVCDLGQVFIPLGELVDLEEEKKRLEKELERVTGRSPVRTASLPTRGSSPKRPKSLLTTSGQSSRSSST